MDVTHIVKNVNDDQNGHPEVKLPQHFLFHDLALLMATELCVWILVAVGYFVIVINDILGQLVFVSMDRHGGLWGNQSPVSTHPYIFVGYGLLG